MFKLEQSFHGFCFQSDRATETGNRDQYGHISLSGLEVVPEEDELALLLFGPAIATSTVTIHFLI